MIVHESGQKGKTTTRSVGTCCASSSSFGKIVRWLASLFEHERRRAALIHLHMETCILRRKAAVLPPGAEMHRPRACTFCAMENNGEHSVNVHQIVVIVFLAVYGNEMKSSRNKE